MRKSLLVILSVFALLALPACVEEQGTDDPTPVEPVNPDKPDPDKPKVRKLYVSPEGSDSNAGTSSAFPYQTFEKVLSVLKAGDEVNVMPGTFVAPKGRDYITLKSEISGTKDCYTTFKAYDPNNKPVIYSYGEGIWTTFKIYASYVIIDGLEFMGGNAQIDSLEAYNNAYAHQYKTAETNWSHSALFNTNDISVDGEGTRCTHHVTVKNCVIHDFPGGGLGGSRLDYVTFDNNLIYNCAWYCMYACSGISIIHPFNSDENTTTHKLIISNNRCFNNMTKIPWYGTANFNYSDGNGIIVDVNLRVPEESVPDNLGIYRGRTLVYNNLSVGNGGSGIHTFKANHVDVINNTSYHNGRKYADAEYGEIYSNQCSDVNIVNNIMYARPGGDCNKKTGNSTEVYENNLYFNGAVRTVGINGKTADPLFVNPSLDPKTADFHIRSGSPAIGAGARKDYAPSVDIEGNSRSERLDLGAYQNR